MNNEINETGAENKDAPIREERTCIYDDLHEALRAAVPEGGYVHTIGFDSSDRILRYGYRLTDDPAGADVLIARGGEREFGTARAKAKSHQKVILLPTHALAACKSPLYLTEDGAFSVTERSSPPFAAVFDPAELYGGLPSVFGELASLDLCAFDMIFGARMRGEKPDLGIRNAVSAMLNELSAKLDGLEKDREYCATALIEAGKKAADIVEACPGLLHCSGASQMTEAVRMLYRAEERQLGMRGETEMLLVDVMIEFYAKNLGHNSLEFPPDNNKRIDSICEYFGADIRRACIHTTPVYPPIKMRLCEYRREEFRAELAAELAAVRSRRRIALKVFKRLYPDDGYCLRSLIDKTDLGICLALAPDVYASDSMLSFLKQTGKLDKYII